MNHLQQIEEAFDPVFIYLGCVAAFIYYEKSINKTQTNKLEMKKNISLFILGEGVIKKKKLYCEMEWKNREKISQLQK